MYAIVLCTRLSPRDQGLSFYILCPCAFPCPCSGHCIYVSVYLNQLPAWHSLHTFRHATLPRSCPECQSQTSIKFCEAAQPTWHPCLCLWPASLNGHGQVLVMYQANFSGLLVLHQFSQEFTQGPISTCQAKPSDVSVYLNQLPAWHSLHTFRHATLPRSCPECQSQTSRLNGLPGIFGSQFISYL